MTTLTVIMITRNAAKVITDALQSVKGLWNELLVSDEHSSDGTEIIARQYGAKLIVTDDKNLGNRKQALMNLAKSEWILILDSDERVSRLLYSQIQKILKGNNKMSAYRIPYQNYFFGQPIYFGGENYSKIRLFQRNKASIRVLPVHEEIEIKGEAQPLTGVIKHYSYRSFFQVIKKFTNYAFVISGLKNESNETLSAKKLFLYAPHMFWSRFIVDEGWRDGWHGFVLAASFSYMELITYWFLTIRKVIRKIRSPINDN